MSTLDKLTIAGIRSFDPQELQQIDFECPLTLILGPNGSGKTTVIECLKYATCSQMPPGGKGALFLHDLKLLNSNSVKAQIRLRFHDIQGGNTTITRNLEVLTKGKTSTFKTLEGTFHRERPNEKEPIEMSSKQGDLDTEVQSLLGVSKAVLENVIFCHQEDTCWPLSEGKVLKTKFDDIFESGRYAKALDELNKLTKQYNDEVKISESEVSYLKQNRDKAIQYQSQMEKSKKLCTECTEMVAEVDEELVPISSQLKKIAKQETKYGTILNEKSAIEAEHKILSESIKTLRSNITRVIPGTLENLKDQLCLYSSNMGDKERALEEASTNKRRLETKIAPLKDENDQLLHKQMGFKQKKTSLESNIADVGTFCQHICSEFGISGSFAKDFPFGIHEILDSLKNSKCEADAKFECEKAELYDEEKTLTKAREDINARRSATEQIRSSKKEHLAKLRKQISDLEAQLELAVTGGKRLEKLTSSIVTKKKELENLKCDPIVDKASEKLNKLEKQLFERETEADTLQHELTQAMKREKDMAAVISDKKRLKELTEKLEDLKVTHSSKIDEVLGFHVVEPSTWIGELDSKRKSLQSDIKTQEDKLTEANAKLIASTERSQNLKSRITALESEASNLKKVVKDSPLEVESLRKSDDVISKYEEQLAEAQEELDLANTELGASSGYSGILTSYISQLTPTTGGAKKKKATSASCSKINCPLCERPFKADDEVEQLKTSLQTKLTLLPEQHEINEERTRKAKEVYDGLLQLRSCLERQKVLDKEISTLVKEQTRLVKTEIPTCQNSKTRAETALTKTRQLLNDLDVLAGKISHLADLLGQISDLEVAVAAAGNDSLNDSMMEDSDSIQAKISECLTGQKKLRTEIGDVKDSIQSFERKCADLEKQIVELGQEKVTVGEATSKADTMKERRDELVVEQTACEKTLREAVDLLGSDAISGALSRNEAALESVKSRREILEKSRSNAVSKLISGRDRVSSRINDISSLGKNPLDAIEQQILECAERKMRLEDDIERLQKRLESANELLRSAESGVESERAQSRELRDQIEMMTKQKRVDELDVKLASLEEQCRFEDGSGEVLNPKQLRILKERLSKQEDELKLKRQQITNQLMQHSAKFEMAEKELLSDQFSNATQQFHEKMIEYRTSQLMAKDTKTFYHALDQALGKFHSMKMTEINRVIGQLWRHTYRGEDIDAIEIRHELEDAEASLITKTSKTSAIPKNKRRSFNYRVVMLKSGKAIDMRARCSAGQKVLACLIIRLALAEAFSTQCGVLALDEPTTNLDGENVTSLAESLVSIVNNRAKQASRMTDQTPSNRGRFQLIVITHDTAFIDKLGKCAYANHFFCLSKNAKGYSTISKHRVTDLNSMSQFIPPTIEPLKTRPLQTTQGLTGQSTGVKRSRHEMTHQTSTDEDDQNVHLSTSIPSTNRTQPKKQADVSRFF